ncbi:MAG: cation-translocating P-type ATPase, partial [Alphaproteobacteria bacterium]|nr:cation-translocating P-type ATPase [Alphaproteobacteria bacterium]
GIAEATATGPRSRVGAIGAALATLRWPPTPLQLAMARLVRRLALAGVALSILVGALHYARLGDWLEATLAGVTLAMSAMPEQLPMVLAIFLAMGAWRLSRHGVLARQPSAVLALGATTVLCVDKTGTITENRIRLERLAVDGTDASVAEAVGDPRFDALRAASLRASHPQGDDPMDRANLVLGSATLDAALREYPIEPGRPRVAFAWRDGAEILVAAKGAPEEIARLCRLDGATAREAMARVEAFAAEGLRVLAVATARAPSAPEAIDGLAFAWAGLLAYGDPVRDSARASIEECLASGIKVVMITGDYPATACAVARHAGIDAQGHAMSGAEVARTEPGQSCGSSRRCARGHVVAMTGDGVNDAPALRAAHVGVAMGSRGTDVAREAAGLVVLNDDLGWIVAAIRLGRRIADNIRKTMVFVVAVHVPLVGLALLPLLLGWPPMLAPVHVIFLELVIDPACAIVFEAQEAECRAMRRPPRPAGRTVASPLTISLAIAQGCALLACAMAAYGVALQLGLPQGEARALGFVALVAGTLCLALTNLSWDDFAFAPRLLSHPSVAVAAGTTSAMLALRLAWPAARGVFALEVPGAAGIALAIGAGAASVLWFEAVKRGGLLARGA